MMTKNAPTNGTKLGAWTLPYTIPSSVVDPPANKRSEMVFMSRFKEDFLTNLVEGKVEKAWEAVKQTTRKRREKVKANILTINLKNQHKM